MKLRSLFLVLGCFLIQPVFSQSALDVFRLIDDHPFISARSFGMGGAYGAVGADPSAAFSNPAGIAVYRSGVMDMGARLMLDFNTGNWEGQKQTTGNVQLPIDHFTYVRNYATKSRDWRYLNGAFSFGNVDFYKRDVAIDFETKGKSLLDAMASGVNGINGDSLLSYYPFDAGLAWYTYGIDTLPGTVDEFYANYGGVNSTVIQKRSLSEAGKKWDLNYTFSGNFRDQLFIGGTVALRNMSFVQEMSHQEEYPDQGNDMKSMIYDQNLDISASAFQLRLGLIYVPELLPWLRLGVAFHSRSNYLVRDQFSSSMITSFTSNEYNASSPINEIEYLINTPQRFQFNTAMNIMDKGVWTLDVETIDFSRGRIKPYNEGDYAYSKENASVMGLGYSSVLLKSGFEFRLSENFRARCGGMYQSKPHQDDAHRFMGNVGVGYRGPNFFFDLGAGLRFQSMKYTLYDLPIDAASGQTGMSRASIGGQQFVLQFSLGWRISEPVDNRDEYEEYNIPPPVPVDPF